MRGPDPTSPLRPPDTFETERLIARKPRADDAPAVLAAYAGDELATRYLSWRPYTNAEPLAEFLQARADDWEKSAGHYAYLLCPRGTDTPIGSLGVLIEGHRAMFGYVLGRPHWGKGYMTEALRHLLDWAMAQPQIHRGWAYCAAENPSSARVMKRAGMTREGVLHRWQVFPNIGPEPRDCIFYSKVK